MNTFTLLGYSGEDDGPDRRHLPGSRYNNTRAMRQRLLAQERLLRKLDVDKVIAEMEAGLRAGVNEVEQEALDCLALLDWGPVLADIRNLREVPA